MFARLATRVTIALLRGASLSIQDRTLLTAVLLNKLGLVPASDIIKIDQVAGLKIGGKKIAFEEAATLRKSALKVLAEPAWKIVHDQVTFEAIKLGIHKGNSPEEIYFSKVALWWKQQELEILSSFGQTDEDEIDEPI